MTPAQIEHAPTFRESLPAQTTLERMKKVCRAHSREMTLITNRQLWMTVLTPESGQYNYYNNQLTQAQSRLRRLEDEMIEVARQLVAEADNAELITEQRDIWQEVEESPLVKPQPERVDAGGWSI